MPKMTHKDESVLSKLQKIARLAEQGYKGEAENARRQLEAMLTKYGLTIEDLCENATRERTFKYHNKYELQLFISTLKHRFGSGSEEFKTALFNRSSKTIFVNVSDIDYADLAAEWEYYRKSFERELKETETALLVAFIRKLKLFDITAEESDSKLEKLSLEEIKMLLKAIGLEKSIGTNPYVKQLNYEDNQK